MSRVAATILVSLVCAGGVSGQDDVAPPRSDIVGTVMTTGARFAPREVLWPAGTLDRDVELTRALEGRTILDGALAIDPKTGGIANCVVWLPDFALSKRGVEAMRATISDCAITPRVQILRRGGPLELVNSDGFAHSLELLDADGGVLTHLDLEAGETVEIDAVPEAVRSVASPALPFMQAWFADVGDHPAVITDVTGSFKFSGVPAGEVRFRAWHETLGDAEKVVTVGAEPGMTSVEQRDFRHPISSRAPFGTTGGAVLRVDGVAVGRGELERLVGFYRERYADFVMPDAVFTEYSIRRAVIPIAAAWSHFRFLTPELDSVAAAVLEQLDEGHAAAAIPGLVPGVEYAHVQDKTRRDLDPALGSRVFGLGEPGRVGPFHTAHGQHIVIVTEFTGMGAAAERTFHHLFIPYDRTPLGVRAALIRRLVERARVEVLDPGLERHVPEGNRR